MRRAAGARSLLGAAAAVALLATVLLTGLVAYGREVVVAGAADTITSGGPERSSVLVRGAGFTAHDPAVRARLAPGFAGRDVRVSAAAYASGFALAGGTGAAVPDQAGVVFADVVQLDDLPGHADLVAGSWPRPGATPVETVVGVAAAEVLGVGPGGRMPVVDRRTGRVTPLVVSGVWRPRDLADPFWRLTPDVTSGVVPGSATYGPLVVDRAGFTSRFASDASGAWLAAIDLDGAGPATVREVAAAVGAERDVLPEETGLGTSASVESGIDTLADALLRADLVGRSALVTPMLLTGLLSGLALVLVAVLLVEHRRPDSALLRARGAGTAQLAGLAAAEATALVLPSALLAPPAAAAAVHVAGAYGYLGLHGAGGMRPAGVLWLVAGLAALGCVAAMTVPVLRRGTYTSERPPHRSMLHRSGADVALFVLALLAWLQLRQYASPLFSGAGGLGIDPLLAAAPTLSILAGATLALRLLAPATRLAQRLLGREPGFGSVLGMWQVSRRPHAGPVFLLALAVAAGTAGWCLAATAARSVTDQADHAVGADLRLEEITGTAPAGRERQLAVLPGARTVLPGWRESVRPTTGDESAALVAVDGAEAGKAITVRDDLYDGGADALASTLTARRADAPAVALPPGRRLTGRLTLTGISGKPLLSAVLMDDAGTFVPVPLSEGDFSVPLPDNKGLRLAGFTGTTDAVSGAKVGWRMSGLAVDGAAVALDGGWARAGSRSSRSTGRGGSLAVTVPAAYSGRTGFALVRPVTPVAVPVVTTEEARRRLQLDRGSFATLRISGGEVRVRLAGTITTVPGSDDPAAFLADLPTLRDYLWSTAGIVHPTAEWWVTADARTHDGTAAAAAKLGGLHVLDRRTVAASSGSDAYGVGGRTALLAAAIGALLLAATGMLLDIRTTTRRRLRELAVLHTLGAGPRVLTRALLTEQAFLAGVGVLAGLAVGVAVTATVAPLLVLTPQAARPVPEPALVLDWWGAGGTVVLLLGLALGLSALAGAALPRRLAGARLYMGADGMGADR
ncbi:ABC transporter permease [Winogradskya consettensis]|uniref:ABC3 transporter permease C-terminal domain-containing protein n=1 Tax=Winogradskya consettensis TaxID=113560 RepID=A0A919S9A1_9ACTN|nr:hypothetical protein Aco04nite_09790 [Actinoplanes consettensis]